MQRVLDIDLDFFLADCCELAPMGQRPPLIGAEPWEEDRVYRFLTEQCGLREDRKIPGEIFTTHDEALVRWEAMLAEGRLTAPFHVTHIDAHSDLGIGKPGPGYVIYNVLAKRPEDRPCLQAYYDEQKLDEANYLLFALAFRHVGCLENVRAPRSRPDIPRQILTPDGNIRMPQAFPELFERRNGPEPVVPFHVYNDYTLWQAGGPYDYMSVAVSPRYAPKEADRLLPVFERFMA